MRNIKKARLVTTFFLIFFMSLSSLPIASYGENISLNQKDIEKIGLNKIRLENGIGVMVFDLSKTQNQLKEEGFLTISNTYNSSITISCQIITKLSSVDLNPDGSPRIHPKISNTIIIYPIPDNSWIILAEKKAVINPYSIYNFRYTIDIPLNKNYSFDSKKGYLVYINIKKTIENATGANIGIDYNYKLFILFNGELKQGLSFGLWMFIPISLGVCIGTVFILNTIHKKKKTKQKHIRPDNKPVYNKPEKIIDKPIINNTIDIRHKIDNILEGRNS